MATLPLVCNVNNHKLQQIMNFFILFCILFISLQLQLSVAQQKQDVHATGMCSQEKSDECKDSPEPSRGFANNNYNSISHYALAKMERAKEKYIPCSNESQDSKCQCHQQVWKKDLEIFKTKGIKKEQMNEAKKFGTAYKILSHKLFRDANCFFPSRCEGIEYFLLKLVPNLPDMDFIINTRDYPQVSSRSAVNVLPVFSFSKTSNYRDIMYPAWTFWAGGPAIKLFPTGIGRWDLQREKISQASEEFPWESKLTKGFFRGSRTSHERDSLILLSRSHSELVDAMYTKNQAWKSPKDTLGSEPADEVSFEYHCRFKYLFNFRGVAASFRFKHLFLCKSLVFHVGDEWLEFFYPALQPWKHYIPLAGNPSQQDIQDILEFFKHNDNLAKEIAEAGYEFIWNHLRMKDVDCYWKNLMADYAKLLKYKVEEDKSMIEIKIKPGQKRIRTDEF